MRESETLARDVAAAIRACADWHGTPSGPPGDEGDFHVTADKPINVLGYMIGSENLPPPYSATGDPAAANGPPTLKINAMPKPR